MGFLDKAKKMAEQAQTKLDEVQQQFNESQGASDTARAGGPVTEYDKHGRPVAQPEAAAAPPPAPSAGPQADHDDEYAPPKLTSGDPLEG